MEATTPPGRTRAAIRHSAHPDLALHGRRWPDPRFRTRRQPCRADYELALSVKRLAIRGLPIVF
jgi:hypothetical protein